MNNPKFKIGDTVELIGIYRSDKLHANENIKGVVIEQFTDINQVSIGGSYHGCVVDNGVGAYGEGALKLSL